MNSKPIPFKAEMVRAIQDDRKSQTRRVAKFTCGGHLKEPNGHRRWHPDDPNAVLACPYGQPGDRLWVQETWAAHFMYDDVPPRKCRSGLPDDNYWFRADPDDTPGTHGCPAQGRRGRWRPSIFMSRWASRITLEITGIRVERVQDISEADAKREGVEPITEYTAAWGPQQTPYWFAFMKLWHSLNAKRGYGWDVNPLVWVIEFKRLEP